MARPLGIIAYGTQEDRDRLAALAAAESRSGSEWIIRLIRERYEAMFGKPE